ncbi:MAG: FAD-dependent oxidoreductase [Oscillospiraceae bacterium]|jgi:thioredoxin reductase (NADPH)|nr:FAD-dependent oxidoreductase [Oscillospiraceae bacterium]
MSDNIFDIIIIGNGPAGLSAAISVRARGKAVAVLSNPRAESGLYKARVIDNYPGFPGVSGAKLSGELTAHAQGAGAKLIAGRALSAISAGGKFGVSYGSEFITAKALIIATGAEQVSLFDGESELLGRGVSYCATCDGMLYRGKNVVAICLSPDAREEADYLKSIGCNVTELMTESVKIVGDKQVTAVNADGVDYPCDGVFIFRNTIAYSSLLPALETTEDGSIRVDSGMRTNIDGVFAAGDCAGRPHQIAKAVGEGQIAALNAAKYIDGR